MINPHVDIFGPRHRRAFSLVMLAGLAGCASPLDTDHDDIRTIKEQLGTIQVLDEDRGLTEGATLQSLVDDLEKKDRDSKDRIEIEKRLARIAALAKAGESMDITLPETRRQTLQNNLSIQAVLLDPAIAKQAVRLQQAKFESTFNLSVTQSRTVAPLYNPPNSFTVESDLFVAVPSVNVPLRSGGNLSVDWTTATSLQSETTSASSNAQVQPGVSITQPILRDAGYDYNESSIVIAQAGEARAEAATQYSILNTLLAAETAYWNLYRAAETLKVQKDIFDYTKKTLDDTRTQVNAGYGSISSVYNFEVTLSTSVSQLLSAEDSLAIAVRSLKSTIQDPEISLDGSATIVPSTKPILRTFEFDKTLLVDAAVRNRADLLELEAAQIEATIEVLAAKNQLLPELDFIGRYNLNGFDPAGRSLPTARGDLFDGTTVKNPAGFSIGVTASVPLGNEAADANYQSALFSRLQAIANTRQQEITVATEVLNAIDSLEFGWRQILVARYEVAAANRNLEAMKTLFQMGERTSTDLANAINLLALARINSVSQDANYQIDLANLAAATGCLLGHAGVEWKDASRLDLLENPQTLSPPLPYDVADAPPAEADPKKKTSESDDAPTPATIDE
ncbi:MAG: TolC family protein [Phycisphaerales bacterium]|nr:TolC family protein [Phycisphaerales bacterium]